jgi:predicted nucleic acid-binding protein
MADALFDPTVFIDDYRGDEQAGSLVEAVLDGTLVASVSSLTSFEIWIGIRTHEEEMDDLGLLDAFEEVTLASGMSRLAATWLRQLGPTQSEAVFRDALIAASASLRGELLFTRNVRDFRRFYPHVRTY